MVCRVAFGAVLIFALAGCAHTPDEILSYCHRWAAKYEGFGTHDNPYAYRQDLISTCMALKKTPYAPQKQHRSPIIPAASVWINASVPEEEYTKTLGRDKANCIERGYVGQSTQGEHSGEISGFGLGSGAKIGGSENERYSSVPVFNEELFVACMNAAGWEFAASRPLDPDPIPPAGSEADSPAIAPAD
jgi:hypothetical protein